MATFVVIHLPCEAGPPIISMTKIDIFISQLQQGNRTLPSLCDFAKIEGNVDPIRVYLSMLNALVGCQDIPNTVRAIFDVSPQAFEAVLPILVAVRAADATKPLLVDGEYTTLKQLAGSPQGVMRI